jgi:predicted ester cyclase
LRRRSVARYIVDNLEGMTMKLSTIAIALSAALVMTGPLAGDALAKHYLAGWEAWNAGDKVKFGALYAKDAVSHWPDDAAMPERRGGDAIVDEAWNFRAAFPDAKATAKLVFVNGRTLAAVWQTNGTNTAAMKGPGGELPPTGKAIGLLMFHQATLNDANQIVDEWFLMDSNSLMTQLGLAPGPARPALAASAEPPMIVVSTGNDAEKNNLNVTQKGDEDFNKHDVAAVNDSWADDGVESDVAAPEDVVGKASARSCARPSDETAPAAPPPRGSRRGRSARRAPPPPPPRDAARAPRAPARTAVNSARPRPCARAPGATTRYVSSAQRLRGYHSPIAPPSRRAVATSSSPSPARTISRCKVGVGAISCASHTSRGSRWCANAGRYTSS